jgi:hypothetical protein
MKTDRFAQTSATAAIILSLAALSGCAGEENISATTTTVTVTKSASTVEDGLTRFSLKVFATKGVIPGVENSCMVKSLGAKDYDSAANVSLWKMKSDEEIDQLAASGVLGIGWLQHDGNCNFHVTLEFPTPPTPPHAYRITISPDGDALTTGANISSSEIGRPLTFELQN